MRVQQCEDDVHEIRQLVTAMNDPRTGIIASVTAETGKLKDRLNIWGSLLIGAGVAGGLISGEAGTILKAAIGAG